MRHKRTLFCILFIFLYSVSISLAVPPTTKYQPGTTLDPLCAPGDTNCSIQVLPDQTGNANTFLTTDGSITAWSAQTFVLGGNFATTGAYTMTLTATGTTALTLPTTGTLATTANINTAVSGTTNYIPKFTGTNTIGNSLIYDDGTNIGINDTSPSSRLTVGGDIRIKAGSGGAIIFADGTSINTSSIPGSAGSLANTSDAIITGDSDANATGDVILKTASNDRLHILNSGNIGINTATPSALFSVGATSPFQVTNLGAVSALSYSGAGTNLTGTAASLTAGNVTTNANLTGHITSTGNATSLGSFTSANLSTALSDETGTGLAVFDTSPVFTTPNIGSATGSISGNAGTVTNATFTTALTVNTGTLTLTANSANNSVLTIGAGAVSVSGTNTGDNAANSSSTFIGTTSVALNRASAALTLAGITLTTPDIGTPSAGVVTNLTGTASININGTVGATTPTTGAFTTGGFSNNLSITGNHLFTTAFTNVSGRIGEYDATNRMMLTANQNGSDIQDDGTKPSWGVVMNANSTDTFYIGHRAAAAGASAELGALMTVLGSNGNVGIGTTTPTEKLDVTGNIALAGDLIDSRSSLGALIIRGTNADRKLTINTSSSGASLEAHGSVTNDLFLGSDTGSGYQALTIQGSTGYVGVGTTSPQSKLDISYDATNATGVRIVPGYDGSSIQLRGTPNSVGWYHSNIVTGRDSPTAVYASYLAFLTENKSSGTTDTSTEKMRILGNGNVGIGTMSPSDKLDVFGTVRASTNTSYYSQLGYTGGALLAMTSSSAETADNMQFTINGGSAGTSGNAFVFKTQIGNTTPAEMMRITKAGNVGIGTTAPTARFNVGGADPKIVIGSATPNAWYSSGYDVGVLQIGTGVFASRDNQNAGGWSSFNNNAYLDSSSGSWTYMIADEASMIQQIDGYHYFNVAAAGTANTPITWTTAMAISSGGNVGIGTAAPLSKLSINGGLHVGGDSDAGDNNALIDGTLGVTGRITATAGITIPPTASANALFIQGTNDYYSAIIEGGPTGDRSFGLKIQAGTGNNVDIPLNVRSYADVALFTVYGAGQIYMKGNVGIGTTGPGTKLHIVHDGAAVEGSRIENTNTSGTSQTAMSFVRNGSGVGSITATNTATAYNTSSDRRLKENITDTHYGLADLMNIQVSDFSFIRDTTHTLQNGFIAQQLQTIYPEAVHIGGDDPNTAPWAVDYGRLTPLIVKSIQEMNIQVQGIPTFTDQTLYTKIAEFLRGIAEQGTAVVDKVIAGTITADQIQTPQLCVGTNDNKTCVNADQLQQMINQINNQNSTLPSSTPTPDPTPPDDPGAEDTTLLPQDVPTPSDASDSSTPPASDPTPTPPTGGQ